MKPILHILIATLLFNTAQAQFVFTKLNLPILSTPNNTFYTKNRWAVLNNKLYFTCTTNDYGTEIWQTDGTPSGTKILKDIYHDSWNGVTALTPPPPNYQEAPDLRVFNGKMFFSANDSTHGTELWHSDGSTAGTQMLIDLMPGRFRGCYFKYSAEYNGRLYFTADSNQYQGKEPWVTDGTATGTFLLKDINPGILQLTNSSEPRDYHQNFGLLYFIANTTSTTTALYQTNGTTIGTVPVVTDTMPPNIQYSGAPVLKNTTFYTSNGNIWTYDGTFPGMQPFKPAGMQSADLKNSILYNGKLYFSGTDTVNGNELWLSDGTENGTSILKDINPGSDGSGCSNFVIHKGLLYFTAKDTGSTQLWTTDGTTAGTRKVTTNIQGTMFAFTSAGDRLYFMCKISKTQTHMYYSDGTDTGTHMLTPSWMTPNDTLYTVWVASYAVLDKAIYIYGRYDSAWFNLWKIEDTTTTDTGTSIHYTNIEKDIAVNIYPNPARTYLSVKTTTLFKQGRVIITDMAGHTVQTATMQQGTETQITLNDMPPGMYMVDVWLDERRKTQKLLIQ